MKNECCKKDSAELEKIKNLKKDFDVLSDVNRLRVLCLIKEYDNICVCDISEFLELPQNLVSYHLAKLKEAGFVKSSKHGVRVEYRRSEKRIKEFELFIDKLLNKF